MTSEQAKALLPIIQAHAEGRRIELKRCDGKWEVARNPDFSASPGDYRLKVEPRVIWKFEFSSFTENGSRLVSVSEFSTQEEAEEVGKAASGCYFIRSIKFVEEVL